MRAFAAADRSSGERHTRYTAIQVYMSKILCNLPLSQRRAQHYCNTARTPEHSGMLGDMQTEPGHTDWKVPRSQPELQQDVWMHQGRKGVEGGHETEIGLVACRVNNLRSKRL